MSDNYMKSKRSLRSKVTELARSFGRTKKVEEDPLIVAQRCNDALDESLRQRNVSSLYDGGDEDIQEAGNDYDSYGEDDVFEEDEDYNVEDDGDESSEEESKFEETVNEEYEKNIKIFVRNFCASLLGIVVLAAVWFLLISSKDFNSDLFVPVRPDYMPPVANTTTPTKLL